MQVIKRDGRVVAFDKERIVKAIEKAMTETINGTDNNLSKDIAQKISDYIEIKNEPMQVEEIQDIVEDLLMDSDRKDVAKRYIIYRNERQKTRDKSDKKNKLLNEDFVSKYKHTQSPMNQLGTFVYYRTYSRWLEEERRREYWWETVRRVVEYNCNLAPTSILEAEKLYDNIFNLKQFLSGRTFWVGGTEIARKFPASNFNCAFSVIDSFEAFKDLFYLLMIGTGFGFRVLKEDVDNLPKIKTNLEVIHKDYIGIEKKQRQDNTSLMFNDETVEIVIGDSKEGWTQSLDYYFKMLWDKDYREIKRVIFNYNHVRPKGEKLKTFGGTASGFESIKTMFYKIENIIKNAGKRDGVCAKLKPIDCMDIANIIGENVVVGGVRRTSENTLFDEDDADILGAKENLYIQENNVWVENSSISHRKMSNNSIFYKKKPKREQLKQHLQKLRYNGEPGFVNTSAAKKRRGDFNGLNPCFAYETKILTDKGYKEIGSLENQDVNLININGNITKGKVWCSGEKELIKLKLSNGTQIRCTEDHIFMTNDNEMIKAKELKGKRLMPELITNNNESAEVILIKKDKIEKVYDFLEPETNWGIVEGFIAHNCFEVLLDSLGLCNLTTINVYAFVDDSGILDKYSLFEAQKLNVRASYRMTLVEIELHKWDKINKRDRLLGCSLTGWQDMVDKTNISKDEEMKLLEELKRIAHDESVKIAEEFGLNVPLLVTTIKPEGTLSLLPGVSPGLHYSHAPYYIRRIRINSSDPLLKVCEELGYPIYPEVGEEWATCKTKVIEFPVKSPVKKTKYDLTAIEQLENYKKFMYHYVDHNASVTITVADHEWDQVEEWIWDNWDDVVAISLLPLSESFYQLMPYEIISEEEYNQRVSEMKPFIPSLITKYEREETEFDLENSDCEGGICSIR